MSASGQVLDELVEGLVAQLHGTEFDCCGALLPGRMNLPECQQRLVLTAFVESDGHSETARVVVLVTAVIHDQPFIRNDLEKGHTAVPTLAVWGNHVKAPQRADSRRTLLAHFAAEAFWTKPFEHAVRLGPGAINQLPGCVDDTTENNLALELAVCIKTADHRSLHCCGYLGMCLCIKLLNT